jgi:two-component system response regulator AtoC
MQQVLIVDDEANIRKVLTAQIKAAGYQVLEATNGIEALELLNQGEIDAVISDLRMPQLDGLGLLKKAQEIEVAPPIIVITAHGSMSTAIEAMKLGAFDFITKPFDKTELLNSLRKATSTHAHAIEAQSGSLDFEGRFDIIGTSTGMQSVYKIIEKAADTPSTVLITGESGTGKELIATALHRHSQRSNEPLIRVNCAAIPSDLIESEFFGYEQGAFTGAVSSKPGRFELANGGTLFLDEIAEIPPEVQVKLLRALQESEFERIGGVKTIKVDVRVIAATNRNLLDDIEQGRFREDLYYRLNVVPIELPPLRERRDDIPLLVKAFLEKYNRKLGKELGGATAETMRALMQYDWPGNIRELENVIERGVLFAESTELTPADLSEQITRSTTSQQGGTPATAQHEPIAEDVGQRSMKDIVRSATDSLERGLITKALQETNGNVTRAAHLLQISRKGLQNKMKELRLRDDEKNE